MQQGLIVGNQNSTYARSQNRHPNLSIKSSKNTLIYNKNQVVYTTGTQSGRRAVSLRAAQSSIGNDKASPDEVDVIIIGSGIGGLSCASLLAKYGLKVLVLESHYHAGGAAHSFLHKGYHFEAGPSLYSGMAGKGPAANPIAHVLSAIDEVPELIHYDTWNVFFPEGQFLTKVGDDDNMGALLRMGGGPNAQVEWDNLREVMKPLAKAASIIPPAAIRYDFGVVQSVFKRYWRDLLDTGSDALSLTGPFSKILDANVTDKFLKRYMDLLCFLLSGLPAKGTISAEMAFMFNEWFRPGATLEFPKGGSAGLVDCLVRGVTKFGGEVKLSCHVEQVMMEGGRATGVVYKDRNGVHQVKAKKAVVSNASMWDTMGLIPDDAVPGSWRSKVDATPQCNSFMHAHLGIDATGLPPDLDMHHILVNSWENGIDAPQNVVLVSIGSVADPSLAPEGKHCIHAYMPATEPYSDWANLTPGTPEYEKLKKERSEVIWTTLRKIIPDIEQRTEVSMIGTPKTHARFLNRNKGTYGPAIVAGKATFPGPTTPIKGLYMCGDSTFPGIGVPAVAASGNIAANTIVPVASHIEVLEELGL